MALIAFAAPARVEEKVGLAPFAVWSDLARSWFLEADFDRVENIVASMKSERALVRRIEQIAQRWDRAVVQIRRAQPDSVERRRNVTIRIELRHRWAIYSHLLHPSVRFLGRRFRPRMRSFGISPDLRNRDDFVREFSARFV